MRSTILLAAAALAVSPAIARDAVPYYGPKTTFGEGYKEQLQGDGSWRVVADYNKSDPVMALDVALFRAAAIAREHGHAYVQVLGGYARSSRFSSSATVFARPTDSPAAPSDCRDPRCYTADAMKVRDLLSGPSGQPGVARPSSIDRYGRPVSVSGYGTGAIAWGIKGAGRRPDADSARSK